MRKRLKKLSVILAASLILSGIPASAFATEPTIESTEEAVEAETVEEPEEEQATVASEEEKKEDGNKKQKSVGSEGSNEDTDDGNNDGNVVRGSSTVQNEEDGQAATGNEDPEEGTEPEEQSGSVNSVPQDEDEDEEAVDTTSENEVDDVEAVSDNEAEESLSENAVSENEIDESISDNSISDNSISENEVSENSISENEAEEDDEEFIGGNIDMTMDFEEDTVAEIAEAGEAKLLEYARIDSGDATIDSADAVPTSYYESIDNYVSDEHYDISGTALCWAYAAANMAEINMVKKGLKQKDDNHISANQIALSTYNDKRHDYYGETWDKASNAIDFDAAILGKKRDYTAISGNTAAEKDGMAVADIEQDPARLAKFLRLAKGNLFNAVFDFERWAAPNSTGFYQSFEGNTDMVEAELENAIWVPNTDINSIKTMIRDYGSAGIQVYSPTSANNAKYRGLSYHPESQAKKTSTFKYVPLLKNYQTNHAIVLVGWDDSIDRSYFATEELTDSKGKPYIPNSNGAFLAKNFYYGHDKEHEPDKNSLGGEYFWISYEDSAFKKHDGKFRYAVAYDFVSNKKNDYTYGYDGTNYFNTYQTRKVYGIFKAGHTSESSSGKVEMLKSVGVGVQDAGRYKLTIYSGYDPSSSKQYLNSFEVESKIVEFGYPGFHTIELDDPIFFFKNDVISVCFEKADATDFNVLVDGANYKSTQSSLLLRDSGVVYNFFTHTNRESVECYFATAGNSNSVVSGNRVPLAGSSKEFMKITPRMRLYTSDIQMPQNIDQTMLDIKLNKYVWSYTGKKITPLPEVMIDFGRTNEGEPKDRGGKIYSKGLVMYNKINDVESHYNYIGVNNTNTGVAAVIVRGKGDVFSGEVSAIFKIVDKDIKITDCKIMGLEPQNYKELGNGKNLNATYGDIKKNMIVKYYIEETKQYVTLTEGQDYAIGSIEGDNGVGKKLSVMVTGMGAFTGTTKPKFKLRKAKQDKPISDATISVNLTYNINGRDIIWEEGELPEVDYTGSKIKMGIASIYDSETGTLMEPGREYDAKIRYRDNKNPGMASIIIKAKRDSGYSGQVTRYFYIKPMHVTRDATVKFKKGSYKYTGSPIHAYPTVKLYGKRLRKKDLYIAYSNNTGSSTGTATAQGIVFGKGRYMGYIGYGTFTIAPESATKSSSTTSSSSSKT